MRTVKNTVDTTTPCRDDIKAVIAMKVAKKALKDIVGLENDPIIPDAPFRIMTLGPVGLWAEVIGLHNKYIVEIKELTIDEDIQGRGIGTSIMYAITRSAEHCGAKVGLWVKSDNKKSLKWYKRMGFKPKAKAKNGDIWLEGSKFNFDYMGEK